MIGMNLPSMFGGILRPNYWQRTMNDKMFDRQKILRESGMDVLGWDTETASSCDDNEKFEQRYDDDKMELLGASDSMNFSLLKMSQFG